MAVADVYDALVSRRCYKPPQPHDQAVAWIIDRSGSHFDPLVIDAFVKTHPRFRDTARRLSDDCGTPANGNADCSGL